MEKIYKIFPKYVIVTIVVGFIWNGFVYWGSRLFTFWLPHYDISTSWDKMIPFVSVMIVPYILAYVTWYLGFAIIGKQDKDIFYKVMMGEMISKLVCLVIFFIFPTYYARPEVTGNGFFDWITKMIFAVDRPDNLFPSIHCLENWIVFRGTMMCKNIKWGYKLFTFIAALVVFASTVLTKQHLLVDILGGILAAEIGLLIANKWNASRCLYALERKMERDERER